jgi:hypothetical protein
MKKIILILAVIIFFGQLHAQNVGIGTANPFQKLTVQTPNATNRWGLLHTDGTVSVGSYVGSFLGASHGFFGTGSNHSLNFFTGGSPASPTMTVHLNGWVGIGTTQPMGPLHIANTSVFERTTLVIGRNHTAGGYTAMYMGNTNNRDGYNYIQSVDNSGTSFGMLALNPYGGGTVQSGSSSTFLSHQVTGNLQAQQNINLGGTIKSGTTGNASLTPLTVAVINHQGVKLSGMPNLSCTKTGPGEYNISIAGETFTNTNDDLYMVMITCQADKFVASYFISATSNAIKVTTMNNFLEYSNTVCSSGSCPEESSFIPFQPGRFADSGFSIIVYKM